MEPNTSVRVVRGEMVAFDANDCRLLARALDYAWELFLKQQRLTRHNVDKAKGALTYAVMESARSGERNARRIAKTALTYVDKYEAMLDAWRAIAKH